jgi:predicted CopG family antitoxin
MAVKTITIDMEAYELLAGARRGKESFSVVIKTVLDPNSRTAAALLAKLDSLAPSGDYLRSLERVVESRLDDLVAAEAEPVYRREEEAGHGA